MSELLEISEETSSLLEEHAGKTYRRGPDWIEISSGRGHSMRIHYEYSNPGQGIIRNYLLMDVVGGNTIQSYLGVVRDETGMFSIDGEEEVLLKLEVVRRKLAQMTSADEINFLGRSVGT